MATRVYTSANSLMADHVHNLLEGAGIESMVKNRQLAGGAGVLPVFETWLEVWVLDESRLGDAQSIVEEALHGDVSTTSSWRCVRCGEELGGQFADCWRCAPVGAANEESPSGNGLFGRVGESMDKNSRQLLPWIVLAAIVGAALWNLMPDWPPRPQRW